MTPPAPSPASNSSPDAPADSGPAPLDTSRAHPARRYDYWLGGKDNLAADRASGGAIAEAFPHHPPRSAGETASSVLASGLARRSAAGPELVVRPAMTGWPTFRPAGDDDPAAAR